jgi:hypothetical protein
LKKGSSTKDAPKRGNTRTADSRGFESTLTRLAELSEKAFASGKFARLQAAVLEAIEACDDASQLWSVLSLEGLDAATFGEDEHPPEVAKALLARADGWGDTPDAASAIALVVRASAIDPAPTLLPTLDETSKPKFLGVLDAHAKVLAAHLESPCAALRSACANALGRCPSGTYDQAEALLHLAAGEGDPTARSAMLLSAGAIARRTRAPVRPSGDESHDSPLVRGCLAAARALVGEKLDLSATASLAALVSTPSVAPDEWGWGRPGSPASTIILGERLFRWLATDAPEVAIDALATVPKPSRHVAESLVHLAFGDGTRIPRTGLARDELTKSQLQAVRPFAQPMAAMGWLRRFCLFGPENVPMFLEGTPPHWKPLDVDWDGGHRWHLWRLWREHVWGTLPRDVAVRAMVVGLGDSLLDAITVRYHGVYRSIEGGIPSEAEHARDAALIVEIVETLAKAGSDPMNRLLGLAAEANQRDPTTLSIALLAAGRASHTEIPEALDPLLRQGVLLASSRAPLSALLTLLPEARRNSILAGG